MTYRDELAALEAKLDEAESELARLRTENDALRRGITPRVAEPGRLGAILGATTRLRLERTIDGELPASAHRELAAIARRALGARGSVISLGRTLLVRIRGNREARFFELRVSTHEGKTHIVLEEELGQVAGGIFGGIGGGVGIGGLGGVLPLVVLATSPWVGLVVAPLWLGLVFGFTRVLYGSIVERRKAAHVELVGELARAAAGAIERERERAAVRVRVEQGTGAPAPEGEAREVADDAPAAARRHAGASEPR